MLYEYVCKSCEHGFETFCKSKDRDEPKKCPECGSEDSRRTEIPSSTMVDPKGGFEMGAVTRKGKVIPGNFGKQPRKGKWYKP